MGTWFKNNQLFVEVMFKMELLSQNATGMMHLHFAIRNISADNFGQAVIFSVFQCFTVMNIGTLV